jgi:hypothetical protein
MLSYLLNTIKIIALISGLLILTFVLINWGDEELKPEVAQALAWQPPHNTFEYNGYLTLLGIEAPAEMSAKEVGTKALKAELARFASMQKNHKEPLVPQPNPAEIDEYIDWKDNQCDYQKQANCVDFYLQQGTGKLSVVILSQERLTARYNEIWGTKNYIEVMPPLITTPFPKYHLLIKASELQRIQAILDISDGKLEQGVARFIRNASYSRRLLRESNILVSHMIAVAMMQRDTRVLSELMAKYPKIATQYATQLAPVLAPISAPEYNLKTAFNYERDMGFQLMNSLKFVTPTELAGVKTNSFIRLYSWLGFQGNTTNNALYEQRKWLVKLAEADASQLDAVKAEFAKNQQDDFEIDYRLLTQKNPVGRILLEIGEPDFASYIERQHDLGGYLAMVNMQLAAMSEGLAKEKIVDIEIHDPYTQKLMPFDVNTGVVTFTGRQASNTNFNRSNIYQVRLH